MTTNRRDPSRVVESLMTVAAAFCATATRRGKSPAEAARQRAALEEVAGVTRAHAAEALGRARAEADAAMIAPVDPSEIEWNVFRMFEASDSETAWTVWLASLLSPENGPVLAALAWRSLCDAVLAQDQEAAECHPEEHGALGTRADWRAARDNPPPLGAVDRERADPVLGRIDVSVSTSGLFVIVENKLEAGWHDGAGDPQAVRYRRFGLKYRDATKQRLGLVLLTNRSEFLLTATCADYVRITYRDLGRALRRNLRRAFGASSSGVRELVPLWPALLTVAAIESELLDLDIRRVREDRGVTPWAALRRMSQIADYLREEER